MPDIREDRSLSDAIAAQTIGDEASRFVLKPMQQVLEETLRGCAVPPVLHQYVQHDAMLVNGAPQIVQRAPNADEHLVQVPGVSRLRPSSAQPQSEDMVPQADKQAHTEIAEREGRQGEQARVINKEEAEKRKDR